PARAPDTHFSEPPRRADEGYPPPEAPADHAMEFVPALRAVTPDKPFFLYFCTGACHSPHHAPADWRQKYQGKFDQGWDVWREATYRRQLASGIIPPDTQLSARAPWVPAWDDVPDDEKPLAARFMECFAAYLAHTDHHIGRVIDFVDGLGELDNTVIVLVSDNGASSEGGPHGSINDVRLWNMLAAEVPEMLGRLDELGTRTIHNNYPWGWTMAGNTPL